MKRKNTIPIFFLPQRKILLLANCYKLPCIVGYNLTWASDTRAWWGTKQHRGTSPYWHTTSQQGKCTDPWAPQPVYRLAICHHKQANSNCCSPVSYTRLLATPNTWPEISQRLSGDPLAPPMLSSHRSGLSTAVKICHPIHTVY